MLVMRQHSVLARMTNGEGEIDGGRRRVGVGGGGRLDGCQLMRGKGGASVSCKVLKMTVDDTTL